MIAWLEFGNGSSPEVTLQPCRLNDDATPRLIGPDDPSFPEWIEYLEDITREAGLNTVYAVRPDGLVTARAS